MAVGDSVALFKCRALQMYADFSNLQTILPIFCGKAALMARMAMARRFGTCVREAGAVIAVVFILTVEFSVS